MRDMRWRNFDADTRAGDDRLALLSRRDLLFSISGLSLCGAAFAADQSVRYRVPLIAQRTPTGCWAAAIAMITSWSLGSTITPREVAKRSNRMLEFEERGLAPLDSALFDVWDMITEAPQTYTPEGFMNLLVRYGPLWVAAMVGNPHVRVVTGFKYGRGPGYGVVSLNDPLERGRSFRSGNKGARYNLSYAEFVRQNEKLGTAEIDVVDPNRYPVYDPNRYPVYFAHLQSPRRKSGRPS